MSWVASADPRVPDVLGTHYGITSVSVVFGVTEDMGVSEAFDFAVALLTEQRAAA